MRSPIINIQRYLSYFIAAIWLGNGLLCKLLNLVPRHEQIVARILGDQFSRPLTIAIGLAEIGMVVWILSGIKSRLNAVFQIAIILVMNVMEFILAPDLLLWGKMNLLFAFLFALLIYYNEFLLPKQVSKSEQSTLNVKNNAS